MRVESWSKGKIKCGVTRSRIKGGESAGCVRAVNIVSCQFASTKGVLD